jgi:hypothetical protein
MRSGRAVHLLQRDSLPCFRDGFSCTPGYPRRAAWRVSSTDERFGSKLLLNGVVRWAGLNHLRI